MTHCGRLKILEATSGLGSDSNFHKINKCRYLKSPSLKYHCSQMESSLSVKQNHNAPENEILKKKACSAIISSAQQRIWLEFSTMKGNKSNKLTCICTNFFRRILL